MSRFSGKCDFCDEIEIFGLQHILDSDVYVGDSDTPLTLSCLADCVPYYPYLVSVAAHDNVKGRSYIRLTSRSWVDIEEERYGHFNIHDYYRQKLAEEIEKVCLRPDDTDEVLQFIEKRWKKDANWLNGNCYYFALILCHRFNYLKMYYLPVTGHFVSGDGRGRFYDWTGLYSGEEEPMLLEEIRQTDIKWYNMIIDGCVL